MHLDSAAALFGLRSSQCRLSTASRKPHQKAALLRASIDHADQASAHAGRVIVVELIDAI